MPAPEDPRFAFAEGPMLDLYDQAMTEEAEPDAIELLGDGTARYAIIEEIGQGAWKSVSLAHDLSTGRDVAMAVPRNTNDDTSTARFIHEGRILARLEHATIIRLYDLGLDGDENPFFVTKYVSGTTLQDQVKSWRRGKLAALEEWPLYRRIDLFSQICSGVAYAHGRGVIHRDLKPENVLLDDYGQVLICDWGLARLIEGDDAHTPLLMDDNLATSEMRAATLDGVIKGTPGYMAPEQASGNIDDLGPPTDVYALGAILYTLLTFRPPISGRSAKEIIASTIKGNIEKPEAARPDLNLPQGLTAIAMKALSTTPEDRYPTVAAMLADVNAFSAGFAPDAQQAGIATLARLFAQRNARAIKVAGAGIAVAACLAAYLISSQRKNAAEQARLNQRQNELSATLSATQEEAERARKTAEKVQNTRDRITEEAAVIIVDRAVRAYKSGDYPTAFKELAYAMSASEVNERMWRLKNHLHMAKFEIDEALEAASHPTDPRYRKQTELPHLFTHRRSSEHFLELVKKLRTDRDVFMLPAACVLYPPTLQDRQERASIRLALLKILNPEQKIWNVSFIQKDDGLAIDLSNHPKIKYVYPALGSDVSELDLRGTEAAITSHVIHATHVKRIIMSNKNSTNSKLGNRLIVKK